MVLPDFLNQYYLSGGLLVLAFIAFASGATFPLMGEKGNVRIFSSPVRKHLLAVAANARVWRWANISSVSS